MRTALLACLAYCASAAVEQALQPDNLYKKVNKFGTGQASKTSSEHFNAAAPGSAAAPPAAATAEAAPAPPPPPKKKKEAEPPPPGTEREYPSWDRNKMQSSKKFDSDFVKDDRPAPEQKDKKALRSKNAAAPKSL